MDHFEELDGQAVNPSTEPAIGEVISRRTMLKGMAASSALGLFGCSSMPTQDPAPLGFAEVPRSSGEGIAVPAGYTAQVLLRQGDPIRPGAPEYDPRTQTGAQQEQQFGSDPDFISFMPLPYGSKSSARGLLGVNHENHRAPICFPGSPKQLSQQQVEVQVAAQGFSITEIAKDGNQWRVVKDSKYNRRISGNAPMRISGPAAGHERMKTNADATGTRSFGTLNNCAGGTTPWGTMLTAEENVQNYFSGDAGKGPEAAARKRYAITGKGRYADWGRYFDRWNLDKEPNEPNRWGWIVEIDPYDPNHTSVKRTALGRCAHECATHAVSHDNRIAIYSGDDSRMEFVYKFVTERPYDPANRAANADLLDKGILYAARFEANGKMRWLPLVHGQGPLTAANGFHSQADVVIEARRAGTLLGATPMDRPEDVEPNPHTGNIYVVMTYNERRTAAQVDHANPRAENKWGHRDRAAARERQARPRRDRVRLGLLHRRRRSVQGRAEGALCQRAQRQRLAMRARQRRLRPEGPRLDHDRRPGRRRGLQRQPVRGGDQRPAARRDALLLHRAGRGGGVRARVHARRQDAVPLDPAPGGRLDLRQALDALAGLQAGHGPARHGARDHEERRRRDRQLD
jgi:uncharacterized protein